MQQSLREQPNIYNKYSSPQREPDIDQGSQSPQGSLDQGIEDNREENDLFI